MTWTYVASFNGGKAATIWQYAFDADHGTLEAVGNCAEGAENPLFVTDAAGGKFLLVADFSQNCEGHEGGAISSYAVAADSGKLSLISRQWSGGTVPCYAAAHPAGGWVYAANYGNGTIAALPFDDNGVLGAPAQIVEHENAGKDSAHAHSIVPDAAGRFAVAGELGLDQTRVYALAGDEPLAAAGVYDAAARSGPRHVAFHPSQQFVYVINELDSTVNAFSYDGHSGSLQLLQTLTTLPASFAGTNYCADLHFRPDGRFLYGSNRGHESIVVWSVDAAAGTLSVVSHEPTQGAFPRGFAIDPSGRYLLAANEKSDLLVLFEIAADSGRLRATGLRIAMPAPAGVCFVSR